MCRLHWVVFFTLTLLAGNSMAAQQEPVRLGEPAADELPLDAQLEEGTYARFETTLGSFLARLDDKKAPATVQNFISIVEGKSVLHDGNNGNLVSRWFYRGMQICRVYPGMAIQTGCPNGDGSGIAGFFLDDETKPDMTVEAGSLIMAPQDNRISGSMFAVTCAALPHLNGKAPVFGRVVRGLDVVRRLSDVPCGFRQIPERKLNVQKIYIIRIYSNTVMTVEEALTIARPQNATSPDKTPPQQDADTSDIRRPSNTNPFAIRASDLIGTPAETRLNPILVRDTKALRDQQHNKAELEKKLKELRERHREESEADEEKRPGVQRVPQ
ncbi:peptidylprolyl isomerase [Candidatus Sumerlaeota bacterium]|nr:peptidylprolyl isomerase [Candidatus Sumerlaeota bacterium]